MFERRIDLLPEEILVRLFSFLRKTDAIHISRTCRLFHAITSKEEVASITANNNSADKRLTQHIFNKTFDRAAVAVLPNKQMAIGYSCTVDIWDYDKETVVTSFRVDSNRTRTGCVAYIGQDRIISSNYDLNFHCTVSLNNAVHIHDIKTTAHLGTVLLDSAAECAILLDTGEVALGLDNGKICILDANNCKIIREFHTSSKCILRMCALPNHELTFSSRDGIIRIYNHKNGCFIKELNSEHRKRDHNHDVIYLNNHTIATNHVDGVKIWNYQTGECLQHLVGRKIQHGAEDKNICYAIAPVGKNKIACCRREFTEIWNFETGKLLQEQDGHHTQVICYTLHA